MNTRVKVMADFLVQPPNCSLYNFYSLVDGPQQLAVPETCGQPIQCSAAGVVHCNSAKENVTFNVSVGAQVVDMPPPGTNSGRRHFSYVSEAVQLEVDGIYTQALAENQPQKDSSSAYLLEDLEQLLADLPIGTNGTTFPCSWDIGQVSGVDTDNTIPLSDAEIFNHELPPIPEKDASSNLQLAVTPSGSPNTAKRKAPRHGNKGEAQPSEAPKRKCLWQEGPFDDKDQEKRRKDALRAKKNRERNKELSSRLQEETEARVRVEKELAEWKMKCEALEKIVRESGHADLLASLIFL